MRSLVTRRDTGELCFASVFIFILWSVQCIMLYLLLPLVLMSSLVTIQPGHHIQGAVQGELPLPDYRRYLEDRPYFETPGRCPFYTGYIEGWGRHSETLGKELGLYEHPTDQFGQLSMEAIRCCRLVVDSGMHALVWTQEQAVRFMLDNTAMGEHDARTEVIRYVTWPGQACAYKVGERFIRKMRNYAEEELKDQFDPRDFCDVVLLSGAVTLDVLKE
jgi:uncharacterized protein (DUF885 family)